VVELLCGYNQPQKAEGSMSEHEENSTPELSVEELQDKIKALTSEVEYNKAGLERMKTRFTELDDRIDQAELLVIEAVKEEVLDGDSDFVTSLSDIFQWELMEEHSVKIVIEVTGTIKAPIGKGLEGLEDEIDAEISMSYDRRNDGYDLDLDYGVDVTINERGY
jgi:uncharacterized small protein (DUF1192 family)